MAARSALAIEIGTRRFRALLAAREREGLIVQRTIAQDVPPEIDVEDAQTLGAWVRRTLDANGFPRGKVTVALPRALVVLKRLTLPSRVQDELPAMTRLALQRELPFDADQAVIDFVPLHETATGTMILAVAVPQGVLARTRADVEAAGLEVERIALRTAGSATLVRTLDGSDGECVLAVEIAGDDVEFCILEAGAIRFSRAAPIDVSLASDDGPEPDIARAEAIITEARRTWMSYRIVEGASDVTRIIFHGPRSVAAIAAPVLGEMLGAETRIVEAHPRVDVEPDAGDMDEAWPLAGVLLEAIEGTAAIDFACPRRAVDQAARVRRYALIAVGLLVVCLLAAFTLGRRAVRNLDNDLAVLTAREKELGPRAYRYQRDTYTLAHLKRWSTVEVPWLDHILCVHELVPPPNEVVLDGWIGSIEFRGVRFDKDEKTWSAPMVLSIVLDGEARDRATADALREALVERDGYRASSTGADAKGGRRLPVGFTYRLTTTDARPPRSNAGETGGRDG